MLREEEERGYRGKSEKYPLRARRRPRRSVPMPGFVRLIHVPLPIQIAALRSRSAFVTTEAELKLIASAAMSGESRRPNTG